METPKNPSKKDLFLQEMKKKHPSVTNEDELYALALKEYQSEHEYAEKCRAENRAAARRIQKQVELAHLISILFDPNPRADEFVEEAISRLADSFLYKYTKQIENDFKRCADAIEDKLLDDVIKAVNEKIPSYCISGCDNYPPDFTTVECIAGQYHEGLSLVEMAPNLTHVIEDIIEVELDKLTPEAMMAMEYTDLSFHKGFISGRSKDSLVWETLKDFMSMLDDIYTERMERQEVLEDEEDDEEDEDYIFPNIKELDKKPIMERKYPPIWHEMPSSLCYLYQLYWCASEEPRPPYNTVEEDMHNFLVWLYGDRAEWNLSEESLTFLQKYVETQK